MYVGKYYVCVWRGIKYFGGIGYSKDEVVSKLQNECTGGRG